MAIIDNFEQIEDFMEFHPGEYYKFEALVRNTDGPNPLFLEGVSNSNKNILVKSWLIDSPEYYSRMKNEMKVLCDCTGARLYITLDRKSLKKAIVNASNKVHDLLISYLNSSSAVTTKSMQRALSGSTSVKESSAKNAGTILFDLDTTKFETLVKVQQYSYPYKCWTLQTVKGYHVVVMRKDLDRRKTLVDLPEDVTILQNALGLVYMPDRG